jgi:hypothetical protein
MAASDPKWSVVIWLKLIGSEPESTGVFMRMRERWTGQVPIILAVLATPLVLKAEVPVGWHLNGSVPTNFEAGLADNVNLGSAGFVRSVAADPGGFGGLMQKFSAVDYRGTRLRLSGEVKTTEVTEWAGLWMRIDGPSKERMGFDNMSDRGISGSTSWNTYEVVLDVPEHAEAIAFGVLLVGPGEVQIDNLRFDIVGGDPVPAEHANPELPFEPENLSFED